MREVAARQAVAVPGRLQRPAAAEEVQQRQLQLHLRGRARRPGRRCRPGRGRRTPASYVSGRPTASITTSAPKPPVSSRIGLDRRRRVRDVRPCASRRAPWRRAELPVVDVDGDDRGGAGEPRAGDGRVADAAAADDGDGVAAADVAGVHGGAEAGHHAAAEQAGRRGLGGRVDLGALTGGDQRLLGEGADAERRVKLGAVGEGHLLLWRCACRSSTRADRAGRPGSGRRPPASSGPRSRPGSTSVTPVADRLDDAGRLVAEQERELVVDAALAVVQVGVADPARLDLHDRLTGPGSGTTTSTSSTGAPLLRAMTPVTVCGMGSPHHTAARGLSLLGVRPEFAVSVRFVRCRWQGPRGGPGTPNRGQDAPSAQDGTSTHDRCPHPLPYPLRRSSRRPSSPGRPPSWSPRRHRPARPRRRRSRPVSSPPDTRTSSSSTRRTTRSTTSTATGAGSAARSTGVT